MGLSYSRNTMSRLVHTLADDIRPLPDRLDGILASFASVVDDAEDSRHLPEELLTRMQDMRHRLKRAHSSGGGGDLAITLSAMGGTEAHTIASELVDLSTAIGFLQENPAE